MSLWKSARQGLTKDATSAAAVDETFKEAPKAKAKKGDQKQLKL